MRQYYVAVGNQDEKLPTLMELLTALQCDSRLTCAICCSSRDTLDQVVHALQELGSVHVMALHSDLTDKERGIQITNFKRASLCEAVSTAAACQNISLWDTLNQRTVAPKDLLPVGVQLLVHYDIPSKKETYSRRILTLLGSGKERKSWKGMSIIISFVVAHEIESFRAFEGFVTGPILEMPVHVADVFHEASTTGR